MGLQWQKNSSGNFEAWDTSAKLKAEVEAGSEWAYTYVYVDNYTNPVLGITPGFSPVRIKPVLLTTEGDQVDWVYLYWGDGTGTFVNNPGEFLSHDYNQKSRYNPTLIAKINGSIRTLTFYAIDDWTPESAPTDWPRPSFSPPRTFNQQLNEVLAGLSVENTGFVKVPDPQSSDKKGCMCKPTSGQTMACYTDKSDPRCQGGTCTRCNVP